MTNTKFNTLKIGQLIAEITLERKIIRRGKAVDFTRDTHKGFSMAIESGNTATHCIVEWQDGSRDKMVASQIERLKS